MTQITLFWIALMVILIVIEVATVNLVTIWFACGACGAALVSVFLPNNLIVQAAVFVLITAVLLPLTRPLVKKFAGKTTRTNADRSIGEKAVVIEKIDNLAAQGQVKVLGQVWSARAQNQDTTYDVGESVIVEHIEGVKVIVKNAE